ncbi:MAG: hypothetical protein K2H85_08455 [Allobaculum sp.]|nr:hypothetical protein [Allobaculum sp.]
MSEIKLYIEGRDMTSEVGITQAVYDSYAADYIDTLTISLQDKDGTWSKWKPKAGEKVELQLETLKTGVLYIHNLKAINGIYHVTARSLPPYKNGLQKSEWEKITFLQLAQTMASRLGLILETHGVSDQSYQRLFQESESDLSFLRRICMQEGHDMLIYDGKLIIYDPATLEAQGATQTIEFTGKGNFDFFEREGTKTGTVRVVRTRKKTGDSPLDETEEILINETASSGEGRILTYSNLKPYTEVEARRWASGLLKSANRSLKTGRFKLSLQLGLMAGSIIDIKNSRASAWNGPAFLFHVKHDLKSEVSTLYFRSIGGE